jgi:hypothetical protein
VNGSSMIFVPLMRRYDSRTHKPSSIDEPSGSSRRNELRDDNGNHSIVRYRRERGCTIQLKQLLNYLSRKNLKTPLQHPAPQSQRGFVGVTLFGTGPDWN